MTNSVEVDMRISEFLPAIFRRSEKMALFLRAFEATLFITNSEDGGVAGYKSLQARIQEISALFDPYAAPSEFLPWLSQWAALSAHQALPESRRRELIAKMIPLYAHRGTRAYLEELLRLYTGASAVSVEELHLPAMQIGVRSSIGFDARLGEDPFQFRVTLTVADVANNAGERRHMLELIHRVIRLAKPAHTDYQLVHNLTEQKLGFIIHNRSTLGVDAFL